MSNRARPKSRRYHRTHAHTQGSTHDNRVAKLIDQLTAFEDFQTKILPAIQMDVKSGMTAKELREKYSAIVQARLITDAIVTDDAGKAAAIGKDLLDRTEGKATEKKEVTHKFADMKEEELDAILQSEIEDLEDLENRIQ